MLIKDLITELITFSLVLLNYDLNLIMLFLYPAQLCMKTSKIQHERMSTRGGEGWISLAPISFVWY